MFRRRNKHKSIELSAKELIASLDCNTKSADSTKNTCDYRAEDRKAYKGISNVEAKLKRISIIEEYEQLNDEISGLLSCGCLSIGDIDQNLRIRNIAWYSFAFKHFRAMSCARDFKECYNFLLALHDDLVCSQTNESLVNRLEERYIGFYKFAMSNTEFVKYVYELKCLEDNTDT